MAHWSRLTDKCAAVEGSTTGAWRIKLIMIIFKNAACVISQVNSCLDHVLRFELPSEKIGFLQRVTKMVRELGFVYLNIGEILHKIRHIGNFSN